MYNNKNVHHPSLKEHQQTHHFFIFNQKLCTG